MAKKFESLHSALKQFWNTKVGPGNDPYVPGFSPGTILGFETSTGGFTEFARSSADGNIMLGGSVLAAAGYWPIVFRVGPNADAVDSAFHVFNQPSSITAGQPIGKVVAVQGIFGTQASAGTVTAQITKDTGLNAPGTGTSLTSDSFNLRSTNATRQTLTLSTTAATLEFTGGDRLSWNVTGTPTSFAGGTFVVWVQYYTAMAEVSFYRQIVDGTDQVFFVANTAYTVSGASYVHKTAETTTATLKVQVTKDASTNAPGAGSDLLSNNTNAGFSCTAAANTVQVGTLKTTAGLMTMAAGDRLSVDFSGSATQINNTVVTIMFTPQVGRIEVSYFRAAPAALDESFFLTNRTYEVWDGRQIHAVAAGGASTAQLVKDRSTNAPGAGTDLLSTTWNLDSTANTIQGTVFLTTIELRDAVLMLDGDRLSIDYADTVQSTAGVAATISLITR